MKHHFKALLISIIHLVLLAHTAKADSDVKYIIEIRKVLSDNTEEVIATYGPKESFNEVPKELTSKVTSFIVKDNYYELKIVGGVTIRSTIPDKPTPIYSICINEDCQKVFVKKVYSEVKSYELPFDYNRYNKMVSNHKDFIRFLDEHETKLVYDRIEKIVEGVKLKEFGNVVMGMTLIGKIKSGYYFIIFSTKQSKSNTLEVTEPISIEINSNYELVKYQKIKKA